MQDVANRFLKRSLASLAVVGTLGMALLPSEHVHRAAEYGRHVELVHRHFEPHQHDAAPATDDHGDEDQAWRLDSSFIITPKADLNPDASQPIEHAPLTVAEPRAMRGPTAADPESVHDPPLTASNGLRGPPPRSSDSI